MLTGGQHEDPASCNAETTTHSGSVVKCVRARSRWADGRRARFARRSRHRGRVRASVSCLSSTCATATEGRAPPASDSDGETTSTAARRDAHRRQHTRVDATAVSSVCRPSHVGHRAMATTAVTQRHVSTTAHASRRNGGLERGRAVRWRSQGPRRPFARRCRV